ncbi:MAG: NACHT domain-containing protein [Pseudonocardiaceae bacterium]
MDVLAALLAEAVERQWRKEATERRLLTPDPISMHWSLSDLAVTGSVAAAVGAPESPPAFPPLPQQARITEADLHAGGGRAELHYAYAGLASGRVVVVGAPGAGKSGTAILLLLDALAHRDRLDDTQRARAPVPVLLTAHGWDPNTRSVRDWLRDQLTATYPLFAHRGGAAALVAARDKVALILDGLDEMDATLRPAALQASQRRPVPRCSAHTQPGNS